jgi:hypothetical protein
MKLDDSNRSALIEKLDKTMQNLRNNDYEDKDSKAYPLLSEFIRAAENIDKSKIKESHRVVKSSKALMAVLD